jgi:hypothetical protein
MATCKKIPADGQKYVSRISPAMDRRMLFVLKRQTGKQKFHA